VLAKFRKFTMAFFASFRN